MNFLFLDRQITYTGEQLRAGWVASQTGLSRGPVAAAFLGPCDIAPQYMVDRDDLDAGAVIASPMMLHLIIEHPGPDLLLITTRQRLLMALALELLNHNLGESLLYRTGDDLYLRQRKLSISVATVAPNSSLIHSGFNLRGEGAPVPAIGLAELGEDPRDFALRLLRAYADELENLASASSKVKPVL